LYLKTFGLCCQTQDKASCITKSNKNDQLGTQEPLGLHQVDAYGNIYASFHQNGTEQYNLDISQRVKDRREIEADYDYVGSLKTIHSLSYLQISLISTVIALENETNIS
jgi:hypothetical protein